MSNATSQVLVPEIPRLTIAQRKISMTNEEFRFYVLYGLKPGPWAKVGINDTEYMVGFLPTKKVQKGNTNAGKNVVSIKA